MSDRAPRDDGERGRREAIAGAITFAGQRAPAEALRAPNFEDTAVPADCLASLRPVLERLGWRLEPGQLEDTIGPKVTTFSYTLLECNGAQRALLWVTGDALKVVRGDNLTAETWRRLVELRGVLRSAHSKLYFVHHHDFHLAYRTKMKAESGTPLAGVETAFVVQRDVQQIASLPAREQDAQVEDWFDLDAPAPAAPSTARRPSSQIPLPELRELARQMSRLERWYEDNERRRSVFVKSAGLDPAGFQLDGDAEEAAQGVVFDIYDGRLDQLLRRIIEEADLSSEGRVMIERLLVAYVFKGNGQPSTPTDPPPTRPTPSPPGRPAPPPETSSMSWIDNPIFSERGGKGTLRALKRGYKNAALLKAVATNARIDVGLVNFQQAVGLIPYELMERADAEDKLMELLGEVLTDSSSKVIHADIWAQLSEGAAQRVHEAAIKAAPDFDRASKLPDAIEYRLNEARADLQRVVNELAKFNNPAEFRFELAQREARVMQIEIDGKGMGTAWLVAPDLVVTAYHVVKGVVGNWGRVKAVLDHKYVPEIGGGLTLAPGRKVGFVDEPLLASSDHELVSVELSDDGPAAPTDGHLLDFALLRLDTSVGSQGLGKNGEGDTKRGCFQLPQEVHEFKDQEALFILGHPSLKGDPRRALKLTFAVPSNAKLSKSGIRVRYGVNTEGGNSGSPVMDVDFEPVALHHAGEEGKFNQAVPLDLIVAEVRKQVDDTSVLEALGLA